ncbi:MAG: MgtC/SapB family protein [Peptococcaceae bacterium]|nr:MgtC/SapB family protein [Peptococcaceae bacterium]
MLTILDGLRELTLTSVAVRMLVALLCGGIIGMERELKRHPAGFRTHILVCLGAAMTTLTSQYLYLYMEYFTDMARLGAQVIAGIGFLGAGTIITSRQRVRGLTTAAGLWASAIVGLAVGAGFFEGAILMTVLIELAATLFLKLEKQVVAHSSNQHVFFEYDRPEALDAALDYMRSHGVSVMQLEISRPKDGRQEMVALLSLRLAKHMHPDELLQVLLGIEGVVLAEEF